jgi:tRNA threonylcarbamoyladenosine biosynthesis protein TsaE
LHECTRFFLMPVNDPVHTALDHAAILGSCRVLWPHEEACAAFAASLAQKPQLANAHITLQGPLGAGKTTFVRHLLRALGVTGRIKSPTFAVLEPYSLPGLSISHFDFYRFTDAREWADAGFRDIFAAPGLKLCEWPQHVYGLLPLADLQLHIDVLADDTRAVRCDAGTPLGLALLPATA